MPECDDVGPKRLKKKKLKSEINNEIISNIIAAYKNKPQLWRNGMREKINSKQKEDLMQELTQEINTKCDTNFKWTLIRKQLTKLQQNYQNEIEEQLKSSEANANFKLWYAQDMDYLRETVLQKLKHKRVSVSCYSRRQIKNVYIFFFRKNPNTKW